MLIAKEKLSQKFQTFGKTDKLSEERGKKKRGKSSFEVWILADFVGFPRTNGRSPHQKTDRKLEGFQNSDHRCFKKPDP